MGYATFGRGSRNLASQTRQVRDLFHLHSDADDGFASKRSRHHRADSAMNHRQVGHLIDLERGEPISNENIDGIGTPWTWVSWNFTGAITRYGLPSKLSMILATISRLPELPMAK